MIHNPKSTHSLTIVILNYNVRPLLVQCLKSLYQGPKSKNWKIIVVDNASPDDSVVYLQKHFPQVKLIVSKTNLGFSAGNNLAIKHLKTPYTLFLNPDTIVPPGTIPFMLDFMKNHPRAGATTCRIKLPNGHLDDSCHRGFPTPWNAFCHFSKLSKLFPHTRLFTGYSLGHLLKKPRKLHTLNSTNKNDPSSPHPIDACNGAFLLLRTAIGHQLNWWDENYFWYGEDLDFCYRIKKSGWQIYYVPQVKITHFKGASSGLYTTVKQPQRLDASVKEPRHASTTTNKSASPEVNRKQISAKPLRPSRTTRLQAARASTTAMRIFYRKHYTDKYPRWLTTLTLLAIDLLQRYRLRKYS